MLFKFASYLLGTNNDTEETRPEQQLNTESNGNTQASSSDETNTLDEKNNETSLSANEEANITKQQDLIEEEDFMYAEQLINCSKLKNSNCELIDSPDLSKEDHLCDQLEDEDCEDDQWIYITPIKRKNDEEEKEVSDYADEQDEENCILVDDEERDSSIENVPIFQEKHQEDEKEKFNFYDYFNNKGNSKTSTEDQCSPVKSSKLSSSKTNKKLIHMKLQQINRMEESWVIHPPACFQLDNTFTIEQHPLENLYIENPVMASCKSLDKENTSTSSLTNSSLLNKQTGTANRILVDRNNQPKASVASRKSMRKRASSTRKANKKTTNNKKSKNQSKKADKLVAQQTIEERNESIEQESKTKEDDQKQQVLNDRQAKQLLAHYLTMNPFIPSNDATTSTSNSPNAPIASSSNGSTHQSSHNHTHHHYISNNCAATFNASASTEAKKGSKSLRRNNKVALKRDNLSNKPFTLHRKLC